MTEAATDIVWRGADYLRPLLVPIDSLEPWPDNPRRGDVDSVRESFRRFGQLKPVVSTGTTIVAGHHMVLAALELGWTHVAAGDGDFVTDDDARGFLLADNRTSELGFVDEEMLQRQFERLDSYEGIGYSEAERAKIEARVAHMNDPPREDEVPPPPKRPRSKLGEVYELGPHRLMCGDARDPAQVAELMGGVRADVMWTDPPYGVDLYVGMTPEQARKMRKRTDGKTVTNDDAKNLPELLRASFASVDEVLKKGGRFYVAAPGGPKGIDFRLAVVEAGWVFHQSLVWLKDRFVLGHSDYHYQHEDVLYGWKPGAGRPGRGEHPGTRWYGGHDKSSILEVPRPSASEEHPTMKPVELVRRCLSNSSKRGDAIIDPFAGSGSTLVAAAQLGRRCYAMEIDPAYCDTVRARYEALETDAV